MIATERLYLNKDGTRVVTGESLEAASLLCAVGHEIPKKYLPMIDKKKEMPVVNDKELKTTYNKSVGNKQKQGKYRGGK